MVTMTDDQRIEGLTDSQVDFLGDLPTFRNMQANGPGFVPQDDEERELCHDLAPFLVSTSNHNAVWAGKEREVVWSYYRDETVEVWLAMLATERQKVLDEVDAAAEAMDEIRIARKMHRGHVFVAKPNGALRRDEIRDDNMRSLTETLFAATKGDTP
jgi:hypothetical protein